MKAVLAILQQGMCRRRDTWRAVCTPNISPQKRVPSCPGRDSLSDGWCGLSLCLSTVKGFAWGFPTPALQAALRLERFPDEERRAGRLGSLLGGGNESEVPVRST